MCKKIFYAILLALILGMSACTTTPTPQVIVVTATAGPTEKISPTNIQVLGETATPTLKPTVEPTAMPSEVAMEVVEFQLPDNFIPIPDMDQIYGISYVLNQKGPVEVPYPYQSTLIIALGKGRVGKQTFATDGDGTVGNIFADVCNDKSGCVVVADKYKAGHAGVTIIFGGYEIPGQTTADAVNRMLEGESNCGNKCLTVNVGYANGDKKSFTSAIKSSEIALNEPQAPLVEVVVKYPGVPSGAGVVLDDENTPIGHQYYLAVSPAKVSIPETGGTILYCGTKCTIDGKEYDAGAVVIFYGKSDNSTPKDLNHTVKVESSEPNMIRVIMIYGGSFQEQVNGFKTIYPDWGWPKN